MAVPSLCNTAKVRWYLTASLAEKRRPFNDANDASSFEAFCLMPHLERSRHHTLKVILNKTRALALAVNTNMLIAHVLVATASHT